VSETVLINRLYHRELLSRIQEIEELEKKWNCKIDFPSTELASDIVTIAGPEYQVPQAVDAFLVRNIGFMNLVEGTNGLVREWFLKTTSYPSRAPQSFENSSSRSSLPTRFTESSRISTR
jgi:hypothetical protein